MNFFAVVAAYFLTNLSGNICIGKFTDEAMA